VLSLRQSGQTTAECSGQDLPYCWDRACDGEGNCATGAPHSERCRDQLGIWAGCPRRMECVVDPATFPIGVTPIGCATRAGCIIDHRCVAEGALNPANECLVCRGWFEEGLQWAPQFEVPCTPGPDLEGVCVAGACRLRER
jgi:hypothetical protein